MNKILNLGQRHCSQISKEKGHQPVHGQGGDCKHALGGISICSGISKLLLKDPTCF